MHVLLVGDVPFDGHDEKQISQKVMKNDINFNSSSWQHISCDAINLLSNMLNRDINARLSASEVLKHKWLNCEDEISKDRISFDLNKFKKFANHSKVKQAAITCVALNNSNGLVFDLIGLFKEIDKNGDGVITLKEITS